MVLHPPKKALPAQTVQTHLVPSQKPLAPCVPVSGTRGAGLCVGRRSGLCLCPGVHVLKTVSQREPGELGSVTGISDPFGWYVCPPLGQCQML